MRALRFIGGALLALAALTAARTPSPATLLPFLAVLILPVAAAACWTRRWPGVALIAGAIYSLACAQQRLYNPAGDTAFVDQMSTAALCALSVAVGSRLVNWIAAAGRRKRTS